MITIRREEAPYTIVPNSVLQDKGLSIKARGLYACCLSLPADWNISVEGLSSFLGIGKTVIVNALKELKQKGYLKVYQHNENGCFGHTEYVFSCEPHIEKPHTDNAYTEKPHTENKHTVETLENQACTEKPHTENLTLQINNQYNNQLIDCIPNLRDIQRYILEQGYENVNAETFYRYYNERKWTLKNGTPITDWKGILDRAEKNNADVKAKVTKAIEEKKNKAEVTAEERRRRQLEALGYKKFSN